MTVAERLLPQRGGADSSSTIDPSLIGVTTGGADGMALVLRREEVGPNEGYFTWPHPTDPYKALFVVNDIAEQAMWVNAS